MRVLSILAMAVYCSIVTGQELSEFHYDEKGVDNHEFIEVKLPDKYLETAHTIEILLYNGANGKVYNQTSLSDLATPYCFENHCYFVWEPPSIQQGPDGIALVSDGILIEFISYEGVFTAVDGPAAGYTSTDIGVAESNETLSVQSIAKIDGQWTITNFHTRGFNNTGLPPGELDAESTQFIYAYPNKTISSNELSLKNTCEDYLFTNWYTPEGILLSSETNYNPLSTGFFNGKSAGGYEFYAVQACGDSSSVSYSKPTLFEYELLHFDESNLGANRCALMVEFISGDCSSWAGKALSIKENSAERQYTLEPNDKCYKAFTVPFRSGVALNIEAVGSFSLKDTIRIWSPSQEILLEYPDQRQLEYKLTCPASCTVTAESATLNIVIGENPAFIGWELRRANGERQAFRLPGFYSGQKQGDTVRHAIDLLPCEPYSLHLFSANNQKWGNNSWFFSTRNELRSVDEKPYTFLQQESNMYQRRQHRLFTLPCTDAIQLSDSLLIGANCQTTFTIPSIKPFRCYPYFEHALGDLKQFIQVVTEQDTIVNLEAGQTIDLPAGLNRLEYKLEYSDGQQITIPRRILVQDESLRLICNDDLSITARDITAIDSCSFQIHPDVFLENTDVCSNQLEVRFFYKNEEVKKFGGDWFGRKITYRIFLKDTEVEYCGGTLTLEDYARPMLETHDYTIRCNHPDPLNENYNRRLFFTAKLTDRDSILSGTAANPFERVVPINEVGCGDLSEKVLGFQLRLRLLHSDLEDIKIVLQDPSGAQTVLMDYGTCLDSRGQNMNVVFSNNSDVLITDACRRDENPSLNGVFKPVEAFQYQDSLFSKLEGDWQLIVLDNDKNEIEGAGEGIIQLVQLIIIKGFPDLYSVQDCSPVNVEITAEELDLNNCEQPFIKRTLKATDAFGNKVQGIQNTFLVTPTLDDIQFETTEYYYQISEFYLDTTRVAGDVFYPEFGCYPLVPERHTEICKLSITYSDKYIPGCANTYSIQRTWKVLDWCASEQKDFERWLHVIDTVPPSITVDTTMLTQNKSCQWVLDTNVLKADDINGIQFLELTNLLNNKTVNLLFADTFLIPAEAMIAVRAVDGCNNERLDTLQFGTVDYSIPDVACQDTLHLTLSNGSAMVSHEQMLIRLGQDCSPVQIQLRREATCEQDTTWKSEVLFDCCDAGKAIKVYVQISDTFGNKNSCWGIVQVKAGRPIVRNCPSDTIISCLEMPDWESLGLPELIDPCQNTLTEKRDSSLNDCGEGFIQRNWYFNNQLVCQQQVRVSQEGAVRVRFPKDTTINACRLPELESWVEVEYDRCQRPYLQIDTFLLKSDDYCKVMQVRYRVIDWCRLDSGQVRTPLGVAQEDGWYLDDDGYFEWFQTVYLEDSEDYTTISGQILSNGNPISEVQVMLGNQTHWTDDSGTFEWQVEKGQDYTLTASKTGDELEGISVLDLVLLQQHLLGYETLDALTLEKADLDTSGFVSFSDLNLLQQTLLTNKQQFPKSWRIVDGVEGSNHFLQESIRLASLSQSTQLQLEALKMGDLDNSFQQVESRSFSYPFIQKRLPDGTKSYACQQPIEGMALRLVAEKGSTLSSEVGTFLQYENDSSTTWLWSSAEPVYWAKGKSIFEIKGELVSGEMVIRQGESMRIVPLVSKQVFDGVVVYPNPFSRELHIEVEMPEKGIVELELWDMLGTKIASKKSPVHKGLHTIKWCPEQLSEGAFFLKISSVFGSATKRIIRLE